jgi:putative CocE/NonD family hydrolase
MASSEISSQALGRGLFNRFLDRAVSWLLGFPPERCDYTTRGVHIPVSDGLQRTDLLANLLQPLFNDGAKPLGTVLFRSPYGRGLPIGITTRAYAARGYQVLVVSSRGTFGSGGEFDPFRTEVQDGKDVIEWMRKQPWYTGTFATCGGSYLGFVQWALLCDPPEDLVAAVPGVSPHEYARLFWDSGALNLDVVSWADMIAHQEEAFSFWKALTSSRWRRFKAALDGVPLAKTIQAYFDGKAPWLDTILAKSDLRDAHYAPGRLEQALERTEIPVLIITGWYDLFLEQSIQQYIRLKERNCNVALTAGPWSHIMSGFAPQMNRHGFDWIEEHLAGNVEAKRTATVQYFVTGIKEWRGASVYPPHTFPSTYYLNDGAKLTNEPASATSAYSDFTFDPRKPTPTMGGNSLTTGGVVNDSALAGRSDVLVFDTAPLDEDVEFCGKPTIELVHSTNSPFADVFVRVSEVDKKGRSHNVTETYKRLDSNRVGVAVVNLALNHCSHRFLRGKRIRVLVAGGNFPQYAKNHGVEDVANLGSEMRAVEHTVYHDKHRVSKVIFPVVTAELG